MAASAAATFVVFEGWARCPQDLGSASGRAALAALACLGIVLAGLT